LFPLGDWSKVVSDSGEHRVFCPVRRRGKRVVDAYEMSVKMIDPGAM